MRISAVSALAKQSDEEPRKNERMVQGVTGDFSIKLISSRAHQKEAAEALRIDLSVSGCGEAPPPRQGRLRNPRAGSSPNPPGVRLIGLLPSLRVVVVVEESRIESVADWWPSESSLVGIDPADVPS